ncbi:serine hydrolase [Romboutsia maritimum]|uniref:Serine hydrolase n=2 Tax=Romboutsia maritimum TaxID=2020948 RepID=A0A371IRP9_9FIRM|nr:serine hydrolase [Romboutsia maritimum]
MVYPSASTIKLVIMGAVMKEIKEGRINFDDKILLSRDKVCEGDGILKELDEDHQFTIKEIMTLMIILSDNTATNILIDLVGMDAVNKIGSDMGLKYTKLRRKMMDSEAVKNGRENTTTPKEMAKILNKIYSEEFIDENFSKIALDILKRQQVGNRLTLYMPEDVVVAHKTGDLDKLEHDVGIVYHELGNYIICILTKNLDTNKNGREVIGKISKLVYENFIKENSI